MKVYVSGPIKNDPDHRAKFAEGCAEVEAAGHEPVNPLDIGACDGIELDGSPSCIYPGEMLLTGHTWQCYMRFDIAELVLCDGIYLLREWHSSKGAREEYRIACLLAIPIMYQNSSEQIRWRAT